MWATVAVWLGSALLVFGALALLRAARPQRRSSFRWKAALVLAGIAAGVPAFVFQQWNRPAVDVPAGINASVQPPR